jgi:hypothetical protein
MIFKEYNENAGGNRHPMRSVQTKKFGYIFNPWSDGKRVFRTATQGTLTYRRMKQLAPMNKTNRRPAWISWITACERSSTITKKIRTASTT